MNICATNESLFGYPLPTTRGDYYERATILFGYKCVRKEGRGRVCSFTVAIVMLSIVGVYLEMSSSYHCFKFGL